MAGVSILAASGLPAQSFGLASPYNVFVFGNMTESNVDSEGRVAVGGNAFLTSFGVGSAFLSNPALAGNTLVVGGNLSYSGGEVHYGNVVYGGILSGAAPAPHGTVTQAGGVLDFVSARSTLAGYSSYWAGLDPTASTGYNCGGWRWWGPPPTSIFPIFPGPI